MIIPVIFSALLILFGLGWALHETTMARQLSNPRYPAHHLLWAWLAAWGVTSAVWVGWAAYQLLRWVTGP